MRWLPLWIGLAAVVIGGAATAWYVTRFGALRLHARAMPGFDIDLPDGKIVHERLDYGDGRRTIEDPGGFSSLIQLSWEAGGLSDDAEVAQEMKVIGAMLKGEPRPISPAPQIEIPGQKTRSWVYRFDHETNWTTQIVCGARVVKIMTGSGRLGVERLHRRIASSLRCHPDSAKEASVGKEMRVGDVPVVFDLAPGWFAVPTTHPEQLGVTNRRALLTAHQVASLPGPDGVERTAELWGMATGFHLGQRVGDDWPFETTQNGKRMQGWIAVRPCPALERTLVIMSASLGAWDGDVRELLSHARCRMPGEVAQTWPDKPAEDGAKQPAR